MELDGRHAFGGVGVGVGLGVARSEQELHGSHPVPRDSPAAKSNRPIASPARREVIVDLPCISPATSAVRPCEFRSPPKAPACCGNIDKCEASSKLIERAPDRLVRQLTTPALAYYRQPTVSDCSLTVVTGFFTSFPQALMALRLSTGGRSTTKW